MPSALNAAKVAKYSSLRSARGVVTRSIVQILRWKSSELSPKPTNATWGSGFSKTS